MGGINNIVAEVFDENGNKKLVIRANETVEYHNEIVRKLKSEASGFSVNCIGGDRIDVDPDAKTINIWGSSAQFDKEPDRNQTAAILKVAFPEFQVTIGADDDD